MNNGLGSGGLFFLMVIAELSRAVRPVCSGYLAGLVTWVLTIELTKKHEVHPYADVAIQAIYITHY